MRGTESVDHDERHASMVANLDLIIDAAEWMLAHAQDCKSAMTTDQIREHAKNMDTTADELRDLVDAFGKRVGR